MNVLKKLWHKLTTKKRKVVNFDANAESIPEAFGYPQDAFDFLVKDLGAVLNPDDKLNSFQFFINGPEFRKYSLDVANPADAMVVGYAFCLAVVLQRSIQTHDAIENVISLFNPDEDKEDTEV